LGFTPRLEIRNQDLLKILVYDYGVELKSAVTLLETYDEFQIRDNLQVVEAAAKSGKISQNMAGFVVKAIKDNYRPTTLTPAEKTEKESENKRKLAKSLQKKEEKKRHDLFRKENEIITNKFSEFPAQEKEIIISEFKNTLPPTISKSFSEANQDVSSPMYAGLFIDFVKKNNIAGLVQQPVGE
jgi:Fe2+ transport system protein B